MEQALATPVPYAPGTHEQFALLVDWAGLLVYARHEYDVLA